MRKFTHRIVFDGSVCSEHGSAALANKALRRLVAMSNGKRTSADFQIVEAVAESALPAAREAAFAAANAVYSAAYQAYQPVLAGFRAGSVSEADFAAARAVFNEALAAWERAERRFVAGW